MNKLKEKYYIALGNLQNMAIDNTKGSKGVDICVLDINEYIAYLQSKIDKAIEILNDGLKELDERNRSKVYSEEYLENARDVLKEDK